MLPIIRLPRSAELGLSSFAGTLLQPSAERRLDFSEPRGEPALVPADSVSWRVFKNPVALAVGGIAAVILELAEPAVRTGVWKHSTFLEDPMGRLRRTAMAAMVTVYGARSVAVPMIAGVVRMHGRVADRTPAGESFTANDPDLLDWVHATASYGFAEAYRRYVAPLDPAALDRFYAEGGEAARLYGARGAPRSGIEMRSLFESKRGRLEASGIVFEFLRIMRGTPMLPAPLRWLQPMLVRAAVDLVPAWIGERLGISPSMGLRAPQALLVRMAGAVSDRIVLPDGPPEQSCRRLGLPKTYLYGGAQR
jgi:uncharacterized protein (DUF2236 family)